MVLGFGVAEVVVGDLVLNSCELLDGSIVNKIDMIVALAEWVGCLRELSLNIDCIIGAPSEEVLLYRAYFVWLNLCVLAILNLSAWLSLG